MQRRQFLKTASLSAFAAICSTRLPRVLATEGNQPWTSKNFDSDANLRFAIVSDLTGGYRAPVFEQAVEKLNLLRPEFVMSVGDLIEGYDTLQSYSDYGDKQFDEDKLNSQWDNFESMLSPLKMPFFLVPGNHDIQSDDTEAEWVRRFGKKYYHFVHKDVLFCCLNTQEPYSCGISQEQAQYFAQVMRENKNVKWTFVFLHKPIWKGKDFGGSIDSYQDWPRIAPLLKGRKYTVFAGHLHRYGKAIVDGAAHYILATTGAAGRGEKFVTPAGINSRKQQGKQKGEFDHVTLVTLKADGPVVTNLLLDGILSDSAYSQD
jgi:predicted phosphodiesterase